jgi:hypothetical protein
MKNWLSRIFLLAALAAVAVPHSYGLAGQRERGGDDRRTDRWEEDLPERDEFRQSYQLSTGARVELQGINGKAEVETTSGNTAEVHIVRSAHTREDLNYNRIIVEATENSLVVRGENEKERGPRHNGRREVRQRVLLKIPRQVDFTAGGINGKVTVGQIDGPVRLSGINGKVDVAQAMGYSEISGINGKVDITISQLGPRGINVNGVNGGVELRFTDELNADLEVTGNNGKVHADVPNVTIQGKMEPHNFRARIGAGGARIQVDGVNGRVRLTRAGFDR